MKIDEVKLEVTRKPAEGMITVLHRGQRYIIPLIDPETGQLHRLCWDEDGHLGAVED